MSALWLCVLVVMLFAMSVSLLFVWTAQPIARKPFAYLACGFGVGACVALFYLEQTLFIVILFLGCWGVLQDASARGMFRQRPS